MLKDHGFATFKLILPVDDFDQDFTLLALHHVDVDNPELHGEDRKGHRRSPEDEFIVVDVLRWSHCLVLYCWKSNSTFVMLLVMIVEIMAMFMVLMMMINKTNCSLEKI